MSRRAWWAGAAAALVVVVVACALTRPDVAVLDLLARHRQPWLTVAARAVTLLGATVVVVPAVVVLARRQWAWALAPVAGTWLTTAVLKEVVHRARPPASLAMAHGSGFSFPSGHAANAAAAYLAVGLVSGRRRWQAAGVALGVLVAVTRLYLGVHWLTDVLGGLALGWAWALGAAALRRRRGGLLRPPHPGGGRRASA
jgi:undecaprenyl-diphosphatase